MTAQLVECCDICAGNLELVLSLGSSPPTCVMAPVGRRKASEDHHPLELLFCHTCSLGQLSVVVDPEVVFPPEYPYSSGNSRALHENFTDLARETTEWAGLNSDHLVVDIGANDGTLLSKFDCRTAGVEPTGQAQRIEGPAYQEFFGSELAQRIVTEHGPADVVTACNVLAHVADIDDVIKGIDILLAEDGVLVAENHDLASVVGGQWDTIYHEHLRFYSPYSFDALLRKYGLGAWEWHDIPTHGGSFRMIAERRQEGMAGPPKQEYNFDRLARQAAASRTAIRRDLSGRVWGIGATARATTLINYCGLDVDDIECVCEVSGSDKIGHYIPGTSIPVVDEGELFEEQPPRVLLLSWHLADSIVPKLREAGYRGTFVVPLPKMEHRYPQTVWLHKTPVGRFG